MPAARSSWRTVAWIAVAILAAGVGFTLWPRAGSHTPGAGPAPPCPAGFLEQLGRDAQLRRLLRSTDEGSQLLDALGATEVRVCFGDIDVPLVSEQRVLLLSARGDERELAARTGHLLHHVVAGSPFPRELPPNADCEAVMRGALAKEARAYALELRLRRALGVDGARYEFEAAFWRAPSRGERAILDYLLAHPEGGPGLDPLGAGYRQRCETARSAESPR